MRNWLLMALTVHDRLIEPPYSTLVGEVLKLTLGGSGSQFGTVTEIESLPVETSPPLASRCLVTLHSCGPGSTEKS